MSGNPQNKSHLNVFFFHLMDLSWTESCLFTSVVWSINYFLLSGHWSFLYDCHVYLTLSNSFTCLSSKWDFDYCTVQSENHECCYRSGMCKGEMMADGRMCCFYSVSSDSNYPFLFRFLPGITVFVRYGQKTPAGWSIGSTVLGDSVLGQTQSQVCLFT